jgi:RHS repeat-associated protein
MDSRKCQTATATPAKPGDLLLRLVHLCAVLTFHSTGKERDTESGNDYFGARYYTPTMGRWTSPDPSGLVYADPRNPQGFNMYSYVVNNLWHG